MKKKKNRSEHFSQESLYPEMGYASIIGTLIAISGFRAVEKHILAMIAILIRKSTKWRWLNQ